MHVLIFQSTGLTILLYIGIDNNDDYLLNDTLTANIENTMILEKVNVYPNPFSDRLTITINSMQADQIHISLTSVAGIKVYDVEKELLAGNNSYNINDLKLAPSVYYLKIQGNTINQVIRVIKVNK